MSSANYTNTNSRKRPASDDKEEKLSFYGFKRTVTNLLSKWFRRSEDTEPPLLENEIEMFLHLPKRPRLDNGEEEEQESSSSENSSPPECDDRRSVNRVDMEINNLSADYMQPRPRIRRVPPWRLPHEKNVHQCTLLSSDDSSDSSETPSKTLKLNIQQATNQTSLDLSQGCANDVSMWNQWHYKERDILSLNIPKTVTHYDAHLPNQTASEMTRPSNAYVYSITEPSVVTSNASSKKDVTIHMSSRGKKIFAAMNESLPSSLSPLPPKPPSDEYNYVKLKSRIVKSLYNKNPSAEPEESSNAPEHNIYSRIMKEKLENYKLRKLQMEQEHNLNKEQTIVPERHVEEKDSVNENPYVQESEPVATADDNEEKAENNVDSEDNTSKDSTKYDDFKNQQQILSNLQSNVTDAPVGNVRKPSDLLSNLNNSECAVEILFSDKTTELYNTKCNESDKNNKFMYSFKEPLSSPHSEIVNSDSVDDKCNDTVESTESNEDSDEQNSKKSSNNLSTSEWQCGQCGVYQSCTNCNSHVNLDNVTTTDSADVVSDDDGQTSSAVIAEAPAPLDCNPIVKTDNPSIATVRPQSSFVSIFDTDGYSDYAGDAEEEDEQNMPEEIEPHVLQQVLEFAEGDDPSEENKSRIFIVNQTKPQTTVSLISPLDETAENPLAHTFTYKNDHNNSLSKFISPIKFNVNKDEASKASTNPGCNTDFTSKHSGFTFNISSSKAANSILDDCKPLEMPTSLTFSDNNNPSLSSQFNFGNNNKFTLPSPFTVNNNNNNAAEMPTQFGVPKTEAPTMPSNVSFNETTNNNNQFSLNNNKTRFLTNQFNTLSGNEASSLPNTFKVVNDNNASEMTPRFPLANTEAPTPNQFGFSNNKAAAMPAQSIFDKPTSSPSQLTFNGSNTPSGRFPFVQNAPPNMSSQFAFNNKTTSTVTTDVNSTTNSTAPLIFSNNNINKSSTTFSAFGFNNNNNNNASATTPFNFSQNNNVASPPPPSPFNQNNNATLPTPFAFNQNNNATFAFNNNNNNTPSTPFSFNKNIAPPSSQDYSFKNVKKISNATPKAFPFNSTLPDVTQNEHTPPRPLFRFGTTKTEGATSKLFDFGQSSATANPASDFNFGHRNDNNVFKPSSGFGPRASTSSSTAVVSPFNSNPSVFPAYQGENLFHMQSNMDEMSGGENLPTSNPLFGGMNPVLPPVTTDVINRRPRHIRTQGSSLMQNMSQMMPGSPMQDAPMSPDLAFMESTPQASPFTFPNSKPAAPPSERQDFNFGRSRRPHQHQPSQGVYTFGESQHSAPFSYNDGRSANTGLVNPSEQLTNFAQPSPPLPTMPQGLPGTFTIGVGMRPGNPTQVRKVRKARRTLR